MAQQLAQQLAQYDANKANDIMVRIREIEDQEYQRGVTDANTRNALSTQIYEFMQQAEQQRIAQQQWQAEFDESVRQFDTKNPKSSGSSSSNKTPAKTTDTTPDATTPASTSGMTYDDFLKALGGNKTTTSVGSTVLGALTGLAATGAAVTYALKNR